jgi:hypothetical protein
VRILDPSDADLERHFEAACRALTKKAWRAICKRSRMVPNGTDRAPKGEDEIDTVSRFPGPHSEFGLGDPPKQNRAEVEQPDATARYDEAFMVRVARELERGELPTVRPPSNAELEPEAFDLAKPRDAAPRELFPGGAWRQPIVSAQGAENHHESAKTQSRAIRALYVILSVVLVAVVSFVVAAAWAAGPEWRMAQLNAFLGLFGH